LGKFWSAFDWKMFIHFIATCNILGYFMTIWYILYSFGILFPVLVSWTKKNLASMFWRAFDLTTG
jgi:hypothetical protein